MTIQALWTQLVAIVIGAGTAIVELIRQFLGGFLGAAIVSFLLTASTAGAGVPAAPGGRSIEGRNGTVMVCPPGYVLARRAVRDGDKGSLVCDRVTAPEAAKGLWGSEPVERIEPIVVSSWPPEMLEGAEETVALCGPAAYGHGRGPAPDVRFDWCVLYGNAVVAAYPESYDGVSDEQRYWAARFVADHVRSYGFGNPAHDVAVVIDYEIEPYLFWAP